MDVTEETQEVQGHQHVWRYSNTFDQFYCTTPGCGATESAD